MYGALLKLTAMVGVMGVGITTVYQAQQGVLTSAGDTTALADVVSPAGPIEPHPVEPGSSNTGPSKTSTTTTHGKDAPATLNGPGADATESDREAPAVVQLADLNGQLSTAFDTEPARFQRSTPTTTSESAPIGPVIVTVAGSDELFPSETSPTAPDAVRDGLAASPLQEEDPFGSFEETPAPETMIPNAAETNTAETNVAGNPALPGEADDPFGVVPAALPADLTRSPDPTAISPAENLPAEPDNAAPRPEGSGRRNLGAEPPSTESPFDPFGAAPAAESTPLQPAPLPSGPIESMPLESNPVETSPSADPFSTGSMPSDSPARVMPDTTPATPPPAATGTIATGELHGDGEPVAAVPRGMLRPQLSVEKVAPARAVVGQELVYSILIRNTGDVAAAQVLLEDRIPRGTELIGTAPQAELTGTVLKWKLGSLQAGEERKVSIKVRPTTDGAIGSVARVSFVTEVAAEIVVTTPRLDLQVTAPSSVRVGEKVEVTYRLQNTGSGDAVNVLLHTMLPEGLKHPAGGDLEYSLGLLSAGESREVRLELLASKAGMLTCDNDVTTDGGAALQRSFQVEAVGEQLLLARTAQPRLMIGRPTAVTNQVTNEGRAVVDSVEIREIIPAGLEVAEASDGGAYDPNTRSVVWTVGPLAPGEAKSVKAKLLPKVAGQHTAQVTARGKAGSVARVESPFAVVGAPALSIDSLTETRLVSVGEKLVFQAELKNRGTAPARQVVLTIDVPAELELEGATGPTNYRRQGRSLIFEGLTELAPQGGAVYELTFVARKAGECRLPMQISADYLSRPLLREEPVQIVDAE